MSLDLNQNATRKELRDWAIRLALALGASLALAGLVGAAWAAKAPASRSALRSAYSANEMAKVETPKETQLRNIREQEVTQLRIALGRRLPANRRADLYFRTAEIYLELYRAEFLREGKVHEARISRGLPDRFVDRGHSKPFLALGIQACNEILRLKIPFDHMDQVQYFLGFYNAENENRVESEKHFLELVKKYPDSPFVLDAYRELGSSAFNRNDYVAAEGYLESAVKAGTRKGAPQLADGLPRTLHKLAWTYYRNRKYDLAISTMKEAIERASADKEKFLSLREEALRDMAIFMTEGGRTDEAIAYFQHVAGDRDFYPRALERLGRQYERNVEPKKAIQVYEALIKASPKSETAFRTEVKLVDLDLRRGRYADALARVQKIELRDKGEPDTVTAAQNLKAMVRRTATENHERYRKENDRKALQVAESYYTLYLAKFLSEGKAKTREVPEIRMYLADAKRELGKAADASAIYKQVIESKDERYSKEAAALWTASLSEAIRKSTAARDGGKGGKSTAESPSALEEEFVEAADELAKNLKGSNEAREAQLRAAQVLAGYPKTQKDAIKRSRRIVSEEPESAQALTAARLWLQILIDAKASSGDVREAIAEIRTNGPLMKADAAKDKKIAAIIEDEDRRAQVGAIAGFEKDQNFAAAAKGYEEFATSAQKREIAEKAYASAVANYSKAGDYASALRMSEAWIKRFRTREGAPKDAIEQMRGIATGALIRGAYEESAKIFEHLAQSTGDSEAYETAARIHEGYGNHDAARSAWNALLKSSPKAASRWRVLLSLARSYDSDGQDSEAANAYKTALGGPPEYAAEAGTRLGDLYRRAQDEENARRLYRKVAAMKKNPSPFVGYARFRIAELREQGAHFDPMELPQAKLKKALNARLEFVEALSRAYNEVVQVGGPWAIAALDRLATWVYNFASEVDQISPPSAADEKVAASFRKNLKSVSDPLRARAVQTWESAYQKAVSAEILSPALPSIVDHLSEAHSRSVGRAQGARAKLRLAGIPADGGKDGLTTALQTVRQKLTTNARDAAAWVDYGNLLWGEGKPDLAAIAYDRAQTLNSKLASANNNRAVVTITGAAEEDWVKAAQALALFRSALKQDEFFLPAKINLATLLNYYRLFPKAKPLWSQVLVKAPSADVQDGLATATQGMGDSKGADAIFAKGDSAGASSSRFVRVFHRAARVAAEGEKMAADCLSRIGSMDTDSFGGFEKTSVENLKRTCEQWTNTQTER